MREYEFDEEYEDYDYYDEEEECMAECFDVCHDDQCYEECEAGCI